MWGQLFRAATELLPGVLRLVKESRFHEPEHTAKKAAAAQKGWPHIYVANPSLSGVGHGWESEAASHSCCG